jgi:HD superfamily phosphohydrolase
MLKPIEIRCPIYGFIPLDSWEHEIISQPVFQRLRRIRQLAWTDYVYPGAMHTRFEHSLGVMHMATMLYDGIMARCWDRLRHEHGYDEAGKNRYRQLIRLAALLHDVGHGPFPHAVEELAPVKEDTPEKRSYRHEEYSTTIIRRHLKDVVENHKANNNYGFSVDDIAGLIEGGPAAGRAALWQELISGQLDADRMDYLIRDSYHAGVEYGRYDWRRIIATVELVPDVESEELRLGVADGGRHAAEGLIIARYMMFSQVYFHKTRVILDYHLHEAVKSMLPGGRFPRPIGNELEEYLRWDDWKVLGELAAGGGGEHGCRLTERSLHRQVWETAEFPSAEDEKRLRDAEEALGEVLAARREAGKSWYKVGEADLPISAGYLGGKTKPLSMCSTIVGNMRPSRCTRLYVKPEHRHEAAKRLEALGKGRKG